MLVELGECHSWVKPNFPRALIVTQLVKKIFTGIKFGFLQLFGIYCANSFFCFICQIQVLPSLIPLKTFFLIDDRNSTVVNIDLPATTGPSLSPEESVMSRGTAVMSQGTAVMSQGTAVMSQERVTRSFDTNISGAVKRKLKRST